jgi:hypothetical protein
VSVQRTHEAYAGADDVDFDPSVLGHARMVMDAMLVDGQVVPLLGAGVNLCGRTAGDAFVRGQLLPDGEELAAELAKKVPAYPREVLGDLLRVSQCVQGKRGWQVLYRTLHGLSPNATSTKFVATLGGVGAAIAIASALVESGAWGRPAHESLFEMSFWAGLQVVVPAVVAATAAAVIVIGDRINERAAGALAGCGVALLAYFAGVFGSFGGLPPAGAYVGACAGIMLTLAGALGFAARPR